MGGQGPFPRSTLSFSILGKLLIKSFRPGLEPETSGRLYCQRYNQLSYRGFLCTSHQSSLQTSQLANSATTKPNHDLDQYRCPEVPGSSPGRGDFIRSLPKIENNNVEGGKGPCPLRSLNYKYTRKSTQIEPSIYWGVISKGYWIVPSQAVYSKFHNLTKVVDSTFF